MQLCSPLIPMTEQKILEEALRQRRSILIEGESGTGKSMLALWLTAHRTKINLDGKNIERAQLKTIFEKINNQLEMLVFIDAVELIPLNLQATILRIINQHQLLVISTAHTSLAKKVVRGEFRADLYSRLKCQSILLKPLRELPEHLPMILSRVAWLQANMHLDQNVLKTLGQHDWPGNLREVAQLFKNLRHQPPNHDWAVLLKQNNELCRPVRPDNQIDEATLQHIHKLGLRAFLRNLEQSLVQKIYEKNHGHVRKTLQDLKISSGTFYRALTSS